MKKFILIIFLLNMLQSFPASAQNLYRGTSPFKNKMEIFNDLEPDSGIIDNEIQVHRKNFLGSNHSAYFKSKPLEQQLDSVIVYNFSSETDSFPAFKSTYEYVEAEQMTIETVHEWNPLSKLWYRIYKYERKQDEQGNSTYMAQYTWDIENKVWILQRSQELIRDENGNVLLNSNYELRNWNGQEEGFRQEYTYDEQGNRTSFTSYLWNINTKSWAGTQKEIWEYDSLGNVTVYNIYEWHVVNLEWILSNQLKYEYKYNEKGNLESKIELRWHQPSETWITFYRSLYNYDEQGNMIYDFQYRWINTSWAMIQKKEYAYDSVGNVILFIRYGRSNNAWVEEIKEEYNYDEQGNSTMYAWYNWNNEANTWNGLNKSEYAFDGQGNEILFINYQWDVQSASWVPQTKQENQFDKAGRNLLSINYLWNKNSGNWFGNWKNESQFDEFGNTILNAAYFWDNPSNQWVISNMTKNELSYDAYGSILNVTQYMWNATQMALLLHQKLFYFYSGFHTNVKQSTNENLQNFQVYPNPAYDQLFIKGAENARVSIFDTKGKLLFETSQHNNGIKISKLPKGIYLLKVSKGKNVLMQRFVKQ